MGRPGPAPEETGAQECGGPITIRLALLAGSADMTNMVRNGTISGEAPTRPSVLVISHTCSPAGACALGANRACAQVDRRVVTGGETGAPVARVPQSR